jgi:hypothetical protein
MNEIAGIIPLHLRYSTSPDLGVGKQALNHFRNRGFEKVAVPLENQLDFPVGCCPSMDIPDERLW